MPDTPGWFSVLTLLIGYLVKWSEDWFQNQRALKRERETRAAMRRDELYERRTAFQRQTLIELQETMLDLARETGAIHHEDTMALLTAGRWGRQSLGEKLNENARIVMRRMTALTVRVRDDSVRKLANEMHQSAAKVSVSKNKEEE